jgi:hypothetical protein
MLGSHPRRAARVQYLRQSLQEEKLLEIFYLIIIQQKNVIYPLCRRSHNKC